MSDSPLRLTDFEMTDIAGPLAARAAARRGNPTEVDPTTGQRDPTRRSPSRPPPTRPGVVDEPPRPPQPTVAARESRGASLRGPTFQSASAQTPRSLVTGIRADVAESQAYIAALTRGEYGLQRPGGANVRGTDFITARTRTDGNIEVVVTDVKASTVGRFPTPSTALPPAWLAEVRAAVAPGRLDLNNPTLEGQIRDAVNAGRVVLRQVNVDYSPTPQGQGSMSGF